MTILEKWRDPTCCLSDDDIFQLWEETGGLVDLTYDGMVLTQDYVYCPGYPFPNNLRVMADVMVYRNCDVKTWGSDSPDGLIVDGNLNIAFCDICQLPKRLKIGNLQANYSSLVCLPDDIRIEHSCNLAFCSRLVKLPSHFNVAYNLILCHCTNLVELSEDLYVGGDLDLEGCAGLVGLPNNLYVGGDLYLEGCIGLTGLPDDFYVGGDIIGWCK